MSTPFFRAALAAFVSLLLLPAAQAGVVLNGTRLIYPAGEPEVTLKLDNRNPHPALLQVWMDDGQPQAAPEDVDVPFVITPPVFRLEPGRSQTIRVQHAGEALPPDRESLFWLNALEVAPKPKDDGPTNYMQLAFRTRIKVFYRPATLPYSVEQARRRISTRLVRSSEGLAVEVDNPTPYHLSLASIGLKLADRVLAQASGQDPGGMVGPASRKTFLIESAPADVSAGLPVLGLIDDYGAVVTLEVPLTP